MRKFIIVTAVVEVAAGLGILALPSLAAVLLLGASVTTSLELVMGRLCGVILIALGVACWLAREDWQSRAARGLAEALLLYDAGAIAILLYASRGLGMSGVLLWPAVLVHLVLGIWGVLLLARKTAQGVEYAK